MRLIFSSILIGLRLSSLFAGTITCSVTSLANFGDVYPFHSSTSLRYTVSATALSNNLVITAPNGFELSITYLSGYSSSITLNSVGGNIATTTIYARFSPSVIGSASGNIVHSSIGSPNQNIAVTGTCITWAIPTSYYSTVNTQRGATLKTVLYTKISTGAIAVGYTPGVWNAFATTDVQPNGKVWDIYSTRFDQPSPYEFTFITDQDGGSGGTIEGDKYNREHSFPQSWFNSTGSMQSDLNHVFATDKKVNNVRGNDPYGTVSVPSFTTLIGGKSGPNTFPGYTGNVFEPVDEYKGDVARGYFYMATRYENLIAGWQNNGNANDVLAGNAFPAYDAWHINLLLSWHNLDPVSDKEIKRNNAIAAIQNNRNPFIDSPQFVQRIWGGSIPAEPTLSSSSFTITNLSNTSVTLNWKSGNGNRRLVIAREGGAVNAFPTDTFHYNANSNITLAPTLDNGNMIVYNGTGSSVTLQNLAQSTLYHYAVIEYNGWYSTCNYQSAGFLTSSSTTLPVELLSFNAQDNHSGILVQWQTTTETNNAFFTLQRSTDNINWENIAQIKGAGNSHLTINYQMLDAPFLTTESVRFYRLQQTDFDGTENYSHTISLSQQMEELTEKITLLPNPFTNELRISFNKKEGTDFIPITIKNTLGEAVYSTVLIPQNHEQIIFYINNLHHIPAGVYFVQLEFANKQHCTKIVKY
jgi:endonuclease I